MSACQTDSQPQLKAEVPVVVPRVAPAELTTPCPRQPDKPATWPNINVLLGWVEKALYAGSACRALSNRQGEWISSPPK